MVEFPVSELVAEDGEDLLLATAHLGRLLVVLADGMINIADFSSL